MKMYLSVNRIRTGLVFAALLVAGAANAQGATTTAIHPTPKLMAPDKGVTNSVDFYFCPKIDECAVTVTVAKPAAGNQCAFTLTGDDNKKFFYIDRNNNDKREEQVIKWTLVSADPEWSAEFAQRVGKDKGIHFTESGGVKQHIEEVGAGGPQVQSRKVKANKGGKDRRSFLLYDIVVTLKKGSQSIDCDPYGPGIINRGN